MKAIICALAGISGCVVEQISLMMFFTSAPDPVDCSTVYDRATGNLMVNCVTSLAFARIVYRVNDGETLSRINFTLVCIQVYTLALYFCTQVKIPFLSSSLGLVLDHIRLIYC